MFVRDCVESLLLYIDNFVFMTHKNHKIFTMFVTMSDTVPTEQIIKNA